MYVIALFLPAQALTASVFQLLTAEEARKLLSSLKGSAFLFWLASAEIDKLNQEKDLAQLCPYYVNLQGEVLRLQVQAQLISSTQQSIFEEHAQMHPPKSTLHSRAGMVAASGH